MDNYFQVFDIKITNWDKIGQYLLFAEHAVLSVRRMRILILTWVVNYVFVLSFLHLGLSYFLTDGYFLSVFSFILGSYFFVISVKMLSDGYFRRYMTDYSICIRDAVLTFFFSIVISLFFLIIGIVPLILAFIVSIFLMHFVFTNFFLRKKLPDMKIAIDLEPDRDLDLSMIENPKGHNLLKTQIADELRTALVLHKRSEVILKTSGLSSLRLGIGIKDLSPSGSVIKVQVGYGGEKRDEIFTKRLSAFSYFRDRVWNDTVLQLPKKNGQEIDKVFITAQSDKNQSIYLSFPFVTKSPVKNSTNIYIFVIDSLRPEYVDLFGTVGQCDYKHISELRKDGVVYSNAYTQAAWTLPTLGSFLSGLYASCHDQNHPKDQKVISEEIPLLPQILRSKGFSTYGYCTGPRTTSNYGYSRGYDRYYYKVCDKKYGKAIAEEAFSWSRNQDRKSGYGRGQFHYLHLLEAHWPYYPPRDFEWKYNKIFQNDVERDIKKYRKIKGALDFDPEQLDFFKALYKAEIDYCAYELDNFLMYLKDRDVYEDSLIVVMGDHGNNFGEHSPIGTFDVYREFVGAGLVVKYPKSYGINGTVDSPVSANIDIAPTILDVLGSDDRYFFSGESLLEGRRKAVHNEMGGVVISEDIYVNRYSISIRSKRYSFFYRTNFNAVTFKNFSRKNEKFELYDTKIDPGEKCNIFESVSSEVRKHFLEILNDHIKSALLYHGITSDFEIGG